MFVLRLYLGDDAAAFRDHFKGDIAERRNPDDRSQHCIAAVTWPLHQRRFSGSRGTVAWIFSRSSSVMDFTSAAFRTTRGVSRMSNSVRLSWSFVFPNRNPRPGISFKNGMPAFSWVLLSRINPPRATVWPSLTAIELEIFLS